LKKENSLQSQFEMRFPKVRIFVVR